MRCTSVKKYDECITPKEWDYPNITRPFSIIYYVLGGNAFYTFEGEEHPFEKDHLYILPANRVFSLRENPNNKFYSVYIHAFTSPEISSVIDINTNSDPFIWENLKLMRKYAKNKDSIYIRNITDMLLSYIFEVSEESNASLPVKLKGYIDINFIEVFHNNELPQKFSYSNSYLSRIFKEKYNITPKQYAKQLILREAVILLEKGLSVYETAEQLEFSSPENFTRFFKGYYGYSPSRYIKKFKNSHI